MIVVAIERLAEVGLQDGLGWEDIVAFCAGAITVLTLFGLIARSKAWEEFKDFVQWLRKFREDWDGEPARGGRDHTPGVMERLNNIDGEFKRNGGKTMKDSQYRTERAVNDMCVRLTAVERAQRENARLAIENVNVASVNLEAIAKTLDQMGVDPPPFSEFATPVHTDTVEIHTEHVEINTQEGK